MDEGVFPLRCKLQCVLRAIPPSRAALPKSALTTASLMSVQVRSWLCLRACGFRMRPGLPFTPMPCSQPHIVEMSPKDKTFPEVNRWGMGTS